MIVSLQLSAKSVGILVENMALSVQNDITVVYATMICKRTKPRLIWDMVNNNKKHSEFYMGWHGTRQSQSTATLKGKSKYFS
jgi:hypothetical protein